MFLTVYHVKRLYHCWNSMHQLSKALNKCHTNSLGVSVPVCWMLEK